MVVGVVLFLSSDSEAFPSIVFVTGAALLLLTTFDQIVELSFGKILRVRMREEARAAVREAMRGMRIAFSSTEPQDPSMHDLWIPIPEGQPTAYVEIPWADPPGPPAAEDQPITPPSRPSE